MSSSDRTEASVRAVLGDAGTIVVKVGSALLNDPGAGLTRSLISTLSADISTLLAAGKKVLLVSSGAVAEGMSRLGWRTRPTSVHQLQAAAAVGQMGLVQAYERAFSEHGRHTAVVLLTHDDLADRLRKLRIRLRAGLEHPDALIACILDFWDNTSLEPCCQQTSSGMAISTSMTPI